MGTPSLPGDTATESPGSHPAPGFSHTRGLPVLPGGGSVCPRACPPPLGSPGSPGHSASAGGMLITPIKDRGSDRGQGVLTWGCCPPAPPRGWLRPGRVTRDSRTRLFLFSTPGSSGRSAGSRCSGRTMGVPAAPLLLLLLLLLPVAPTLLVSPCFPSLLDLSQELDLTNRSSGCAELDWSPFQGHRRLLLRHNGIEALSPSARLGPRLEELDLAENRLRELPDGFFTNATALRSLSLEGNPLPAVPPAAFKSTLRSLRVSCRCDVLGTVLAPCARGGILCLCLTSHRHPFNVTEFHGRECGPGAGLVAGLVAGVAGAVAVLVAALVAAVWYRRRRAGAAVGGGGRGKQDPAGTLRQPRYISRDVGSGSADVTDGPDYENVFVTPGTAPAAAQGWAPAWQEPRYSPQVPLHEDYFLESAADPGFQPIYANTLGPTEDIYITPDQ
ncbi:leucine-rich repeat-containing protein 25-like isoform X1 [Haemorhous mexicanus]|uniref:leucine-rich repeat-containing protein 25-like isoform X1 n=1 Tax=Haemorhous mexicanus TaxID=30427 RepID=UPI0028BDBEB2|nr:leucine-rich repeat-containing protein 25-like isoform X1 [Haemorhous mexicanus]